MNHYVYLIEKRTALKTEQKYYIGVRSCESKIGDDDYMGSSKYLTEDIEKTGKQHYNKIILKRFDNRMDANLYEIQMHEDFDVANNLLFFNKVKQKDRGLGVGPGVLNPFYGRRHTEEYKQRQSALLKTKDTTPKSGWRKGFKHPTERIEKMSLARKIWMTENIHPMLGVKRTEEMRINNSLGAKNQQRYKCNHCDVVTIPANIKRWHNDNCKKKVK
jgi:hypothetical protein